MVRNKDLGVVAIPPPPKDDPRKTGNGRKDPERRERPAHAKPSTRPEESRGPERRLRRAKTHAHPDP